VSAGAEPDRAAERVRLFVALELPGAVRDALGRWREAVVGGSGGALRPVSTESLHVTLCFLGARSAGEVEAIAAACGVLAGFSAVRLELEQGIWLAPRRPRVLAVKLRDGDGRLGGVQRRLSSTLAAGGWYEPERRAFLPHVTVARVRDPSRLRPPPPLPVLPELSFRGEVVTLLRSRPGPGGSRYEPLARVSLGG
jgi:2'-5' RNA ligase